MPTHDAPLLLFSTPAYRPLADDLARLAGDTQIEVGRLEVRQFPDGEHHLLIHTPVAGRRVALLGGTIADADTLMVYDLACAITKNGALALSMVIPYFGYSTMERASSEGEVVIAKSRARLLSSVPKAHHGNEVLLLDLHTAGLPHYFEGAITPVHLTTRELMLDEARRIAGGDPDATDFVLGSVDAGRAKEVEALANALGVGAEFVIKQRLDGATTRVAAVSAAVAGKTVVLYDDMIRTGGSLLGAAQAYRDAGAVRLAAIAPHGVLPEGATERLRDSGLFEQIVVTDSHPRARELEGRFEGFLHVESIAGLLRDALL